MIRLKMDDSQLASMAIAILIVLPILVVLDYFNIFLMRPYTLILCVIISLGIAVVWTILAGFKSKEHKKDNDVERLNRDYKNNNIVIGFISGAIMLSIIDLIGIYNTWGTFFSYIITIFGSIVLAFGLYSQAIRKRWRVCREGEEVHLHYTDRSFNRCMRKAGKIV